MDLAGVLRLLVDRDRLAVTGALAACRGEVTADDLVARSGADRRTVLETLAALVGHGLVARDGDTYAFAVDGWRDLAQCVATVEPEPHPRIGYGMTEGERDVLARFFSGTRLAEIPRSHAKRLVVLERLALEFEPGVRFTEAEVNEVLGRFHDDVATLRRALVDEGLMDRQAGEYWRSGGRMPS